MRLGQLFNDSGLSLPQDCQMLASLEISSVTCDSRTAGPGSLFFAVRGYAADGHNFIVQAIEKGAAVVVAQTLPENLRPEDADKLILTDNSRRTAALAAAAFYGHPARDLTLVGVTGTNGKTTITWILEQIFKTSGFETGVIGTVNIRYAGLTQDNPVTTPDAVALQETLSRMRTAGVTHVVMEVSSHSLDQYRVEGCQFDAAVFTNLTQDHLDYHEDLEEYFACKKRLFTDFLGQANPNAAAVINLDDTFGRRLAAELDCPKLLVSRIVDTRGDADAADLRAEDVSDEITGLSFTLKAGDQARKVSAGLIGAFNLENILCAAGAAVSLGIDLDTIVRGIETLSQVPGRIEKLAAPLNRHLFVDYAHTPDALASILQTLSRRVPARLITVFGCGGDRDATKRAPMGQIACEYSDIAIVTSDNPRTEDPDAIVQDIVAGIDAKGFKRLDSETIGRDAKGYLVQTDRKKALQLALEISGPGDTIVAAGKGHETYQITNQGTIHFDDREELLKACDSLLTPMDWSVDDLARALGTDPKIPARNRDARFAAIGTDSRTIDHDMVFLALEGETFDGHTFVPGLVEKGIRAFVVKDGFLGTLDAGVKNRMIKNHILVFELPDTLAALGKLANFQRCRSKVRLLAITGSNGKTTTRKMAASIFSQAFDTLSTRGNLNNEIGVPLTLLRLAKVHQWAVIEMGMNHPGEISRLTAIAQPDIAVITNTSGAHLAGLETADNVARAKSEIFEGLKARGTAILFSDDPRIAIMKKAAEANPDISRIIFFGTENPAEIRAEAVTHTAAGLNFTVTGEETPYTLNTPARFMVNNALAALASARTAGIGENEIRAGLAAFAPVKGRMNLGTLSDGTGLIDDTYNANPASMTQALKTLNQLAGNGQGFAALGDMLELGPDSDRLHREIGHLIAELKPARVWLFGTQTAHMRAGAIEKGHPETAIFSGTKEEIAQDLARALEGSEEKQWLLLKGSRGMAMETLIPAIEAHITPTRKGEAV